MFRWIKQLFPRTYTLIAIDSIGRFDIQQLKCRGKDSPPWELQGADGQRFGLSIMFCGTTLIYVEVDDEPMLH